MGNRTLKLKWLSRVLFGQGQKERLKMDDGVQLVGRERVFAHIIFKHTYISLACIFYTTFFPITSNLIHLQTSSVSFFKGVAPFSPSVSHIQRILPFPSSSCAMKQLKLCSCVCVCVYGSVKYPHLLMFLLSFHLFSPLASLL